MFAEKLDTGGSASQSERQDEVLDISVVILTYQRPDILSRNLHSLLANLQMPREIIVVDNSGDDVTERVVRSRFPGVIYIHNEANIGAAGRNRGIAAASGDVLVTLDDDVLGLGDEDLRMIADIFARKEDLGALCFRILHHETGEVCNWCHHREVKKDALSRFATYEISEGAVAFRKAALNAAGPYFEPYFISHEGKDLAYRIMNSGYDVEYEGGISVTHHVAGEGRPDWRRYYYDTRNAIWLAVRNMPWAYAVGFLAVTLFSMGIYSLRDRFLGYWLKAIRDGLSSLPQIRKDRRVWSSRTRRICHEIDRRRPSLAYEVRHRLFRRGVQI